MASLVIRSFPDELYTLLTRRAAANKRTVPEEVIHILERAVDEPKCSILGLQGLGKELWAGVDAGEHVANERESWD